MTGAGSGGDPAAGRAEQPADATVSVKSIVEIVAAIAGSSAVLSALMLYFGWVRTRVLFNYFGVPVGVLQFSTADYVLRSADVFFRPAIWSTLALAGLAIVSMGAGFAERRLVTRPRLRLIIRGVLAATTVICAVLGVLGLVGHFDPERAAVLLAISGALIVVQYAVYRRAASLRLPAVVFVIGVVLTIAAMFWKVSIFAADTGTRLAQDIGSGAQALPMATVYSKSDIGIPGGRNPSGRAPADPPSWAYEYDGFKVLTYANNRWFLIPQRWQPGEPTIILADSDAVRVELSPS